MTIFNSVYKVPDGYFPKGIYHNSTDGLISLSSDGMNWITIADKNLGATTVWNSGDTLSEANCGKYYQWGNNYGFPRTGSVTTSSTQVDASNYGPGNYYSSSTFIIRSSSPYVWDTTNNANLWGGTTGTVEAMQGPAPTGFHIPSAGNRGAVHTIWKKLGGGNNAGTDFGIALKLPYAGRRKDTNSSAGSFGSNGYYWSSTRINAKIAYSLYFWSSAIFTQNGDGTCYGYSVRCFRNISVVPTSSWTKLY